MNRHLSQQRGQGLVEYALILVLVAVVVIAALTVLGPQVGEVYSQIISAMGGNGPLESVTAARTGGGNGNDVVVTIQVSESTTVTVTDSQSGQSTSRSCSSSCQVTLTGVGFNKGYVKVTADGGFMTAAYSAKS